MYVRVTALSYAIPSFPESPPPVVDQELHFQDKYLFYRLLDDEQEGAAPPSQEEMKESDEELKDTLLLLSQIGPDAHMRMIRRKL